MKKIVFILASLILGNMACVAQSFPWDVPGDDSGFQYNMNICGIVTIDDIEQSSLSLAVGAFYGDECRGAVYPYEYDGHVEYWITILGDNPGETLTFKLYDAESNTVLDLDCTCSVEFEIDALIGLDEHFIFSFTTPTNGYTLEINGYNGASGNWYLISSPIGEVAPTEVSGMINPESPDSYDLFRFNQSADDEWENWKLEGDHYHFNLEPGKGYLYASYSDVTLTFVGDGYTGSGEVTLAKDDNANLAGWNLIGNPFGVAASPIRTNAETGDSELCPFYVMNKNGNEITPSDVTSVEPMQGIFVIADHNNETISFDTEGIGKGQVLTVNVTQNRSGVIDRAMIRFGQGGQLPKFMLNEDNTKIYIPQADDDYAVVRSDNEAEMPVSFKAAENGTYTLKVDASNVEMDYLHLIDNMTGNDVDLLETPSYTFEANTTDFANRFKLVFRNTTGIDENGEPFAFFNGRDWTVNNKGKAILQVIDMTGRLISTETIDGTAHVNINAATGVYMLQLTNGNDVKTQKVIIK